MHAFGVLFRDGVRTDSLGVTVPSCPQEALPLVSGNLQQFPLRLSELLLEALVFLWRTGRVLSREQSVKDPEPGDISPYSPPLHMGKLRFSQELGLTLHNRPTPALT